MPLTAAEITTYVPEDESKVIRVQRRPRKAPLDIVPYNPAWLERFAIIRQRIVDALGPTAVAVAHAGSTSVPGLPAKDVIDVDLTVLDPVDEDAYVDALRAKGFVLLLREPEWRQHRYFTEAVEPVADDAVVKNLGAGANPKPEPPLDYSVNLHVWGPDCPEVERHRIFKEYLMGNAAERELYASIKRDASRLATQHGETMQQYNDRKGEALRAILNRAFQHYGLLE